MEVIADKILQSVQELDGKTPVIVAIDGRCAAGKTTLAEILQTKTNCNIFHMDDFFLRPEQRSEERYLEPGGNVDYERFREEVLLPLKSRQAFSYRPFSCKRMQLLEPVQVWPQMLNVVEGSYSCHPTLWDFYDLRIFLTVSKQEQMLRIQKRNGIEQAKMFESRWIPLEEQYFSAFRIESKCDIVI